MSPVSKALCTKCGGDLGADGLCVRCLLQAGLGEEEDSAATDQAFGHYEVMRHDNGTPIELGRGAMGITYKALDKNLRCAVALKTIHWKFVGNEFARHRFLREARAAAQLRHPNIASVFHLGTQGDDYFYVMEFIEGETVEALVKRAGPLDTTVALDIASQIGRALVAMETQQLVHRDIKPANIMLIRQDGGYHAKLIDFGLAKLAENLTTTAPNLSHGGLIGTPTFASPEQFEETEVDIRSDIYSLGLTLWFMLTGRVTSTGSVAKLKGARLTESLPLEQLRKVPGCARELLKTLLQRAPQNRPQTAQALVEALQSCGQHITRRRLMRVAIPALALLSALAAAAIYFFPKTHPPQPAAPPKRSIAVLAFHDRSETQDQEYLSDGISEQIIDSLAKIPGLFVVARTSAFAFKNKNEDVREVGRRLNVSHVLDGSVSRTGGKVRIAAQLINVANGFYVWSETYERDFQNVLSLEDEVSGKVAEALEVRFAAGEKPAIAQNSTRNSEAYDFYLRGRFFWNKRTEEGVRKGIGYFDQAIEKDPNFALGHCGLADSYSMLCLYSGIDPEAGFTTAKAHALKAIELNEKLSDAHTSLAFVLHSWDFDWARAGREYHRAIELAPNSAIAHHWFALYLAEMSRSPEAIVESRMAQKLDPLSLVVNSELALILHLGRQYDEAIAQSKKLLDLQPNLAAALSILGQAYAEKGQYDEAAAAVKQLQAATKSEAPDLQSAYIDAKRGDVAAAEKTLQAAIALRESKEVSPYEIGMVFAALENPGEAFKYLGKALDEHSVLAPILRADPRLDSVRGDPRFGPLLARIGLSDPQVKAVTP